MLLLHEVPNEEVITHPYWYGRVIGIFHVDVVHHGPKLTSPDKQRINFLWVWWFDLDVSFLGGWKALWLHRVGFLNAKSPTDCAFSFLDPSIIIHGAHIIPAFAHGQTLELLHPPQSITRQPLNKNCDWQYYYVNMWALNHHLCHYPYSSHPFQVCWPCHVHAIFWSWDWT